MAFSLFWLIKYEFLPGKRGDICRKTDMKEYVTFVTLELEK